jgi:general stress protein YciG
MNKLSTTSKKGRDMDSAHPRPRQKPGPRPGSEGARRISAYHSGSHEHDQRAGFAVDRERARRAGLVGGETVKERYGSAYYQRVGAEGGKKVAAERGRDYFAAIGKIGGSRSKRLKGPDAPL